MDDVIAKVSRLLDRDRNMFVLSRTELESLLSTIDNQKDQIANQARSIEMFMDDLGL